MDKAQLPSLTHPAGQPSRIVHVVQAVIKSRRDGVDRYLMQYDTAAAQFQPIGGKIDPGDPDPAQALRREMAEELGLAYPPGEADCTLSLLLAGWVIIRPSPTYGILTHYTFDFFQVSAVHFPLQTDQDTCWLSRAELLAGRSLQGRCISTIYQEALGLTLLDQLEPGVAVLP